MSQSVIVYTADGRPVTLYAEPQQQSPPQMPIYGAVPNAADIMAMAQPGKRVTVSFSVERTSTAAAPQQQSNVIGADVFGNNVYGAESGATLAKAIIIIAVMILLVKTIEVIAEHPAELLIGFIAVCCLYAAVALARGGRQK